MDRIWFNRWNSDGFFCAIQRDYCKMKYPDYSTQTCKATHNGCRRALRHLKEMLFKPEEGRFEHKNTAGQVCNNFALKSIRGFFHDHMSNHIDGSVLHENHVEMNVGLCKWTTYVSTLADETKCDPGTIVSMAGTLSYVACGTDMFSIDDGNPIALPQTTMNRGYQCKANVQNNKIFDPATGQRRPKWDDITVSSSSVATNQFWHAMNQHFTIADPELEYSVGATAQAHALGRVTCPQHVKGKDKTGKTPTITKGFFHRMRGVDHHGGKRFDLPVGTDPSKLSIEDRLVEAMNRFEGTQCLDTKGEVCPNGRPQDKPECWQYPDTKQAEPTAGVRPSSAAWPLDPKETNLNTLGGACGVESHFAGGIRVGSGTIHRAVRWVGAADNMVSYGKAVPRSQHQNDCTQQFQIFLPLELKSIQDTGLALPRTTALDHFLNLAWDGVGTLDSAWDSCEFGCDFAFQQSTLCGGAGLQNMVGAENGATAAPVSTPPAHAQTATTTDQCAVTCEQRRVRGRRATPDARLGTRARARRSDTAWVAADKLALGKRQGLPLNADLA